MYKRILEWIIIIRERQEFRKRQIQDIILKTKKIEAVNDEYMIKRLEADINYFELRAIQNNSHKLNITGFITIGRLTIDCIRASFQKF